MSSRALRKLQREQELQKQLAAAKQAEEEIEDSEDEEPEPEATSSAPRNAFDMLEEVEQEASDLEESDSAPVPSIPPEQTPDPSATSTSKPSKPSKPKKKPKKAKKKAKDSAQRSTPAQVDSGDEVDRALKELKAKAPAGSAAQNDDDASLNWETSATKELAIDSKNLNPVNEMKTLFGNIALGEESRSSPRATPQRRREQNQQEGVDLATALTGRYSRASRGKELGVLAGRRNVFMQGKEEWPLASSGGLSMEPVQDHPSFGRWFNIIHSNMYQEMQRQFRMVVESMDPQQMIHLLSLSPYHIATLLQVSEIAKHQGDHSVSADLLERALFSFGRSVHSSFPISLREGRARISFDKAANRELYLTIWRYIRNLEMRGTWKTAFEWAKILLQLNTLSDPYGVTLMIDQLALRGRSHDQLLKLASDNAYGNAWRHLPNIQISLTIAHLRAKQPREARKQLALCIHQYPYIVSALASSLEISPMPKSLWGKLPDSDAEKLYTDLYVYRAKDLWNTPEASALIVEVADTLQYYSSTIDSAPPASKLEISLEEARHIMLMEVPALIALLPRRFTSMHTSSSDVLPPPSSDSDFSLRAPTDGSGVSIMQNLMNAGAATAGTTGTNIIQSLLNFRNWFNTPAAANDNPAVNEDGQAALRELQRDLGQQGMSPEMIEQFLHLQVTAEDPEERITLDDLGMNDHVPGSFSPDYPDSDTNDSMPALEDIPTQETRPTAAPTPPPQNRNPRAATVEEDEDDELFSPSAVAGIQDLIRADREYQPDMTMRGDVWEPNVGASLHGRLGAVQETQPNTTSPIPIPIPQSRTQTQPTPDINIENDPQRLQRWLLTSGLSALSTSTSTSTSTGSTSSLGGKEMDLYIKRMRLLRKQQQEWILNMIGQRGGREKDVAVMVRGILGL